MLQVRDPIYRSFPWIFAACTVVTCIPALGRRMTVGHAAWRMLPVLAYAVVISLASAASGSAPVGVDGNVFHPVEYAGLAFVAQLAANKGIAPRPRLATVLWVVLGCLAFGVLDELHQSFVPHRAATVIDVVLDALGTALGTLIFLGLNTLWPNHEAG